MITKKALNKNLYRRDWVYTNSAREAWSKIIDTYKKLHPAGKILLPSYIGWSSNEGSGIFDSVHDSGLDYDFYELGMRLEINVEDLKQKVSENENPLVLLVHYFGFIDASYDQITNWLITNNVFFVEDAAHAWLTDLIGGRSGRKGSYSFYSLHKLLPLSTGGFMVTNNVKENEDTDKTNPFLELNYDLLSIYNIRRINYNYLCNLLRDVSGIEVIFENLEDGICPQTLPVIVHNYNRDKLYEEMNEMGFGLVSLYHTMIKCLHEHKSRASAELSKKIINLPIHQDVEENQMDRMVLELKKKLNA
ncbi:DegT/DnrJ/EryC1/StrS family aminotransferase [Tenacibaculum sp. 190524A05c]|uniref:dTDP-4-amino-4,6-dideoxygalactose transaminase n=1 Tax=Tenacibaculum platacis TaxID=3137852 RepID=A0ABM9P3X5_9FLAO